MIILYISEALQYIDFFRWNNGSFTSKFKCKMHLSQALKKGQSFLLVSPRDIYIFIYMYYAVSAILVWLKSRNT